MSRYDTRREKGEEHLVQSPVRSMKKLYFYPLGGRPVRCAHPPPLIRSMFMNKVTPRGRRDDMPPPADGSSIQKSRRIYVRLRTGPQSAHLWWPALAKLQAASVPIVWAWDRQTDGSRYSKMPPKEVAKGGSVAEWLACWTQAQKGPGSNRSRDAVG